jgi:DNA polymerase-1
MNLIDNPSHAQAAISQLEKAWALAIDFETSGVNSRSCDVYLMSVFDSKTVFVFDMQKIDIMLFKDLFESKTLIAQNAVFELVILMRYGIQPIRVFDTMLAEAVLECGTSKRKDLKSLVERHLGISIDKSLGSQITAKNYTSEAIVNYSGIDVIHLFKLHYIQVKKLKAKDLTRTYMFELRYLFVMAHTTYHGITLDQERWIELNKGLIQETANALETLNNMVVEVAPELQDSLLFGIDINWNSPKQVLELFRKHVNPDIKGVGDKEIAKYKSNALVKQFLLYIKMCKKVSSFGNTYLEAVDKTTERIHPSYTQIIKTGRLSCKSPNIQNIPKLDAFRKSFVAPKGSVLVVGDYSSQESRILADKSQSPELINFFLSGGQDLHSFVALKAFHNEIGDIPIEQVKEKHPRLRDKAKTANFALVYGGNGLTVARNLDIPEEEGLAIEKAFFEAFPSVKEYFDNVVNSSVRKGFIVTDPVIRRKIFSDSADLATKHVSMMSKEEKKTFFTAKSRFERLAKNYPIQATAANMTKLAGIYLLDVLKMHPEIQFKIILFVHDEILLECEQKYAKATEYVLKECMEAAAKLFCPSVPIPVEPMITPYWTH